jgi:hypothetical protein
MTFLTRQDTGLGTQSSIEECTSSISVLVANNIGLIASEFAAVALFL